MDYKDKVAVVTGGANGIGRALVEEFLKCGARVASIDLDREAAQDLTSRFDRNQLFFMEGDVAVESTLQQFAQAIRVQWGKVDYLINNACISRGGIMTPCSFDDFNTVLKIGITAPYLLTALLLDSFTAQASIVNIASTRGTMSQSNTESYSAAKGGLLALTHALSIRLAGRARVNAISPGWIDTTNDPASLSSADHLQHPVKRVGHPSDIVKMVFFLCSEASSFMTGENITIDGGMSKQMIYHGEHGWTYQPPSEGTEPR